MGVEKPVYRHLKDYGIEISDRSPGTCNFEGDKVCFHKLKSEFVTQKFDGKDRTYGAIIEDVQARVYTVPGKGNRVKVTGTCVDGKCGGPNKYKGKRKLFRPVPGWKVDETGQLPLKWLAYLAAEFIEKRFCERKITENIELHDPVDDVCYSDSL